MLLNEYWPHVDTTQRFCHVKTVGSSCYTGQQLMCDPGSNRHWGGQVNWGGSSRSNRIAFPCSYSRHLHTDRHFKSYSHISEQDGAPGTTGVHRLPKAVGEQSPCFQCGRYTIMISVFGIILIQHSVHVHQTTSKGALCNTHTRDRNSR